jgi:pyruvate,water dikinase
MCWDRGICLGWRDGYVRQGSFSSDEWDPVLPECNGFFGGYFYINLSNVRMQGVRSPAVTVEQLDLAFFGDHPDVPPYSPHPDDERPDLVPKIGEHLGWVMSTTEWPEIDRERTETIALRAKRPDLAAATDEELLARIRLVQGRLQKLFESHCVASSSSGIAPGILGAIGEAIGDPSIPMKLLAGIGDVDSAESSFEMWELSRRVAASHTLTNHFDLGVSGLHGRLRADEHADVVAFVAAFEEFLVDHGSRGPNEWEISAETWETDPDIALAAIDRVRLQSDDESPAHRNAARAAEREALTAEVREKVAPLGEELAGQFEAALVAGHQMAFRERTKTNIVRAVHEIRMAVRELGRRHAKAGDLAEAAHVFMLLDDEVEPFVADPVRFRDPLAGRYAEWSELWELEPPYFIKDGNVPPLSEWARKGGDLVAQIGTGDSLQGVGGCPGRVTGTARVILDATEPSALEPGDILVAPLTDPAWTPLFMPAGGVVVDVGGQISHAIIVSRELGLPCVVSATDATKRIPDGATIEVDGDTGTVTVLELPA